MSRVLLSDHPAFIVQRFKVTTVYGSGRRYTTIETGRGRASNVRRDYEEALLNATYNAMYKHVNKAKGKSDPQIVPYGDAHIDYRTPVSDAVRVSYNPKKGRYYFRDRTGRFAKRPSNMTYISQEEFKKNF